MIFLYLLILLCLGIYSYSQIDLNLTLFQFSQFLEFQKVMIQLGYFNRPLSTSIYVVIILALFITYLSLLRQARNNQLTKNKLIALIIGILTIAIFSYPAFSHDFFNYLFDARIFTYYGQNPYSFKPLDFPTDPWLRFMHWIHRTYPYGPLWLAITVPFSFLGMSKFIFTMLNFKILFCLFYAGNCLLIKKILTKVSPKNVSFGLVLLAFNPLVVIESLISPHLDSGMLFFALVAIYFWTIQKKYWSILAMIFSGGVKFLTWLLAPLFILPIKKFSLLVFSSVIVLLLGLIPIIWQREFYPWYFLPVIGLVALIPEATLLASLAASFSLGLLLRYAPYLYIGSYPRSVHFAQDVLTILPVLIVGVIIYGRKVFKNT